MVAAYLDSWKQLETNQTVVGLVGGQRRRRRRLGRRRRPCTRTGRIQGGGPGPLPQSGTKDFSTFISGWKKAGVEILFANLNAARLCHHGLAPVLPAGLHTPKVCAIGRAVLFPSVVEALGSGIGAGVSTEVLWHPGLPLSLPP
jgi:hypothetical protein